MLQAAANYPVETFLMENDPGAPAAGEVLIEAELGGGHGQVVAVGSTAVILRNEEPLISAFFYRV